MINRSRRQLQRIVKRYREEGIHGLRFKSKRPYTIINKTPIEIEERIINVRKATGFGSEQVANIVNESLNVEYKFDSSMRSRRSRSWRNILARHSLGDAEEKLIKEEYKSFGQIIGRNISPEEILYYVSQCFIPKYIVNDMQSS
jgi:hypothetical protein